MDIFDKIGAKIGQTTQVVKLNSHIANEEEKIALAYQQIGKIIYKKQGASPDADIATPVAVIQNALAAINQLQLEIRRQKGFSNCENCGGELSPGIVFCTHCGHQAILEVKEEICAQCQAPKMDGMAFCSQCGYKYSEE